MNLSNPINFKQLEDELKDAIRVASAGAAFIAPPIGPLVSGALEALNESGALSQGISAASYCFDSRIMQPMLGAQYVLDARYQDKIQKMFKDHATDLLVVAVQDTTANKLGVGAEALGIDHLQTGRTDDLMSNLFADVGMPNWMRYGFMAEFSWANGNPRRSRDFEDAMNKEIGTPVNTQVRDAIQVAYAHWDGTNGIPQISAAQSKWDAEFLKPAADFDPNNLPGKLSAFGLQFLRTAIVAGIDSGKYPSELSLFYDWTIQPEGSSLEWWHSFTHDVWVHSKKYLDDYKAAQVATDLANQVEMDRVRAANDAALKASQHDSAVVSGVTPTGFTIRAAAGLAAVKILAGL